MRLHGWRRIGLGAGVTLLLVMAVLLVSGWGSAVASSVSSVFVTNTSANPVPVNGTVAVTSGSPLGVREANTDANGNVKVHEQGTASVNVTNSTLHVDSAPAGLRTIDFGAVTIANDEGYSPWVDTADCVRVVLFADGPYVPFLNFLTLEVRPSGSANGPAYGAFYPTMASRMGSDIEQSTRAVYYFDSTDTGAGANPPTDQYGTAFKGVLPPEEVAHAYMPVVGPQMRFHVQWFNPDRTFTRTFNAKLACYR
jgi:hypothetical protein